MPESTFTWGKLGSMAYIWMAKRKNIFSGSNKIHEPYFNKIYFNSIFNFTFNFHPPLEVNLVLISIFIKIMFSQLYFFASHKFFSLFINHLISYRRPSIFIFTFCTSLTVYIFLYFFANSSPCPHLSSTSSSLVLVPLTSSPSSFYSDLSNSSKQISNSQAGLIHSSPSLLSPQPTSAARLPIASSRKRVCWNFWNRNSIGNMKTRPLSKVRRKFGSYLHRKTVLAGKFHLKRKKATNRRTQPLLKKADELTVWLRSLMENCLTS